jgi:hypothetical protein
MPTMKLRRTPSLAVSRLRWLAVFGCAAWFDEPYAFAGGAEHHQAELAREF